MKEEKGEKGTDYFLAELKDGSFVMEPYCSCGNHLCEKYYCENCEKQCRPTVLKCKDEETLKFVEENVLTHLRFTKFTAELYHS